jgi:hypothetical protein
MSAQVAGRVIIPPFRGHMPSERGPLRMASLVASAWPPGLAA